MGTLKIIILISYLMATFLAIGGITMSILSKKKSKSELNKAILVFLFAMLAMCFYDWFIYYKNYSFMGLENTLVLRLGSCLIAVLMFFWVNLEQKMAGGDSFSKIVTMFKIFSLSYALFWFVITVFLNNDLFYTIKYLLLFTDIVLILSMSMLSVVFMGKLIMEGRRGLPGYMMLTSSMLLWNYISFVWGEMSMYWGNSNFIRMPLDFTIIFWLIVNIATIWFVYRIDFSEAYSEATPIVEETSFDIDARLKEMKEQYGMTNRETDIMKLIYRGMSNNEIAQELFISNSTVKSHIYNIFRKANVRNRSEIILLIHDRNFSGNSSSLLD